MVIIIAGSPGSGKTTISRNLCNNLKKKYDDYKIYHFEIDDIRSIVIGEDFKEVGSTWLEILANILKFLALQHKQFVIIEGLFYEENTIYYLNNFIKIDFHIQLVSNLNACLERNRNRYQQEDILSDAEIKNLHNLKRPNIFFTIDNNSTIDNATQSIWNILNINTQ